MYLRHPRQLVRRPDACLNQLLPLARNLGGICEGESVVTSRGECGKRGESEGRLWQETDPRLPVQCDLYPRLCAPTHPPLQQRSPCEAGGAGGGVCSGARWTGEEMGGGDEEEGDGDGGLQ